MEVLIVSKSFIIRETLKMIFSKKIWDYKSEGFRRLSEIKDLDLSQAKIVFIDAENEDAESIVRIKDFFQKTKIIVIDKSYDFVTFSKLIKSNIDGYVVDILEEEDLVYMVNKVLRGKKYYDADIIEYTISNQTYSGQEKVSTLTDRENEVLDMVGKGDSNREISSKLYISEHTVKKHITSILSKLDMRNRKDLIIYTKAI